MSFRDAASAPAPNLLPAPVAEAGYQTTEFWGKTVLQVLSLVVAFGVTKGKIDTQTQEFVLAVGALIVPAALEAAYAISRGIRKKATNG